jgi:hypothetical protein
VVKQSKLGSVIWLTLHVTLSAGLVALGVSIAQLIDNTQELKGGSGLEKVDLFRSATTVCYISVTGLQLVHRGIFEEVLLIRPTCCRRKRDRAATLAEKSRRKQSTSMELVSTSAKDALRVRGRKIMLWMVKLLVILFINIPRVDVNMELGRRLGSTDTSSGSNSTTSADDGTTSAATSYHNFELVKVALLSVVFTIAHVSETRFESRFRKKECYVEGEVRRANTTDFECAANQPSFVHSDPQANGER